jgi:hypothetical protein
LVTAEFAQPILRRITGKLFEAEFFVELDVLPSVGLEIAGGLLLLEILDVALHQCRADSFPLHLRGNPDWAKMDVGFIGIQVTPSGEPLDNSGNRLAEGLQNRTCRQWDLFRRRETVG